VTTSDDIWATFSADPRQSPTLKATDADRDATGAVLRDAFADGRLSLTEYEKRLDVALSVGTLGEVHELIADLVAAADDFTPNPVALDIQPKAVVKYGRDLRNARNRFVFLTIASLGIWLVLSLAGVPWWAFWPVIPIVASWLFYKSTRDNAATRIKDIADNLAETRRTTRDLD
jgi:hypothetical protein